MNQNTPNSFHHQPKRLLGLLGYPISHSVTPYLLQYAMRSDDINGFYQLLEIPNLNDGQLEICLNSLAMFGFRAINVTFPYKTAVMKYLDEFSPETRDVGATNCIIFENGKKIGYNSDCTGFRSLLHRIKLQTGTSLDGAMVGLLGAGGVGRAIIHAIKHFGLKKLKLYEKNQQLALECQKKLEKELEIEICFNLADLTRDCVGIINATNIGMLPNTENICPPEYLHKDMWAADMVYNPIYTPFLTGAQSVGIKTIITGFELVIEGACSAYDLFTQKPANRAIFEQALRDAIH